MEGPFVSSVEGVASSEAETFCFLEGRLATLERGGGMGHGRGLRRGALERGGDHPAGPGGADGPHCVRGPRVGLL